MVLAGLKDRGCGRPDVGMSSTRTTLRGSVKGTAHVCLPELHVSFFQRIPNSILVSLVQERLNEDECLRRVRLSSPVRHNAARRGSGYQDDGGRDVSILKGGYQKLQRR